jgi:CHAT domain-containing protein/predicted negative regulator of RcsB-dependent stress response
MSSGEPDQHPIYQLAEQVQKKELIQVQALQQVTTEKVLAQVNDDALHELNQCAYSRGRQNPVQATVLAELNCRAAELKGSDALQGDCHSTLGWLYLRQDRLDEALNCYDKALSLLKPIARGQTAVARVRLEVGEAKMRQGDLDAAIAEYQAVLALARQLKRPYLESDAQNNLGTVYLAQGKADAALAAFQQALEISQKSQDKYGERDAWGNLGRARRFLGHLNEAIEYHRQAVDVSRTLDHEVGIGHQLGLLGSALMEKGELDEAEACFTEALEIARRCNDRSGEQRRLNSLGNLHQARARRELERALQHHRDAIAIAREREDRRGQARHLLHLGNVYNKLKQPGKAQACYREAAELAQGQNAADTQWRVSYAWGNLCAAQGQDKQAFKHYEAAIQIVETQRDRLDIPSREKFWQERTALYKRMTLCCLRRGKLWSALRYSEQAKTRYLADLLSEHASPADNTQKNIHAALNGLPKRGAAVVFNVTEVGTVIFIATRKPKGLLQGLLAVFRRVLGRETAADWKQSLSGRIRATLIEKFTQDDLQQTLIELDNSGKAVRGYLVDYYNDRARWFNSTLKSASDRVYQDLLNPVHRELSRLGLERIVFVPNLGLSLLPLHACQTNGAERAHLLDHYQISYAPSFDVLRHCQEQARSKSQGGLSLIAVANPEKADPKKNLVWAEVEVERIAEFFPADHVRILDSGEKERATDNAVIAEIPNYAFVHFACHGNFNLREPLQSALFLAPPATLTLDKAFKELELSRARLVVMSACETGLVDPGDLADEYVGLPAGFLLAGAPGVVSTLWAVDDLSTALLMQRFYFYHLKGDPDRPAEGPLPLASALRRAQQWLRDEVTAAMAAETCRQRAEILKAQDDPAYSQALKEQMRYERMDPNSHPFDHPWFWAPFTISGL